MLSKVQPPHSLKSTKAFTLIELLLVTFLIGVLSILAFNSYFSSTNTFKFLEVHKEIMSSLRTARSYALTNRELNGNIPFSYGIYLTGTSTAFIAEVEDTSQCPDPNDTINGYCGFKNQGVNFLTKGYQLSVKDFNDDPVTMPVTVLYDWQSGDLHLVDGDGVELSKANDKFIYLELKDPNNNLTKYTVIFHITGLIEEHKNPDLL